MAPDKKPNTGRLGAILYPLLGITILLVLWQTGHHTYGSLVLPSLAETMDALISLFHQGRIGAALGATTINAGTGWLFGTLSGIILGTLAGLNEKIKLILQPVAIIFLGVPAIAWIVLALLWFGGNWAVIYTISVATAPIVFSTTIQGVHSLDKDLARMAKAFHAPLSALIFDVYAPHMVSYLFPALATTLAMSWKVSIMAELLSGAGGIGDGIAAARAHVDTAETMAWIVIVVCILILVDQLILQNLLKKLDFWRKDSPKETS